MNIDVKPSKLFFIEGNKNCIKNIISLTYVQLGQTIVDDGESNLSLSTLKFVSTYKAKSLLGSVERVSNVEFTYDPKYYKRLTGKGKTQIINRLIRDLHKDVLQLRHLNDSTR